MTARMTVRRQQPGRWAVQVWAASGRAVHTVATTTTGAEALAVAAAELPRWRL